MITEYPNTHSAEALVGPDWVAAHLDDPDLRVVELDVSRAAYDTGHIPGAVLWNAYADLRRPDYSAIGEADFADLLVRSGITPASTIVFYGYAAHLGFWLMKRYRHQRVRLMEGPRERWQQAGHSWSLAEPTVASVAYELPDEDERVVATRETVHSLIGRPAAVILDVRSDAEFTGERFWPSGATEDTGRAGHIPTAVHVGSDLLHTEDGLLKPPHELRSLFAERGIDPAQRLVTYCTIGNRASQAWFALTHLLGYPDVSVYYGSWVEWGKLAGTPIDT